VRERVARGAERRWSQRIKVIEKISFRWRGRAELVFVATHILFTASQSSAERGLRSNCCRAGIKDVKSRLQQLFDCTDFGMSNLSLPNGQCHNDPTKTTLKIDCTAHSTEYDVTTNTF
jgi:hypothetical protein